MAHFTGTGPSYATATAYIQGGQTRAAIFSDVGLTLPTRNPFPLVNGAYDFYCASAIYLVVGDGRPFYESTDGVAGDVDAYLAPTGPMLLAYSPSNVTELRAGDFSTLVAADVRSILGTLITDLKRRGVLR